MSQSAVWSANFSPLLATVSGAIAIGDVLTRLPGSSGGYVLCDSTNLATGLRPRAVAVQANSGGTRTTLLAISQGEIDNAISGLGAGAAGNVYVSTGGRLTRTASSSGLVVGWCDTEGNCLLNMQAGALYNIIANTNNYIFDARNYGAVMNGSTDCGPAFQAQRLAMLSATNGAAGGGTGKWPHDGSYASGYYRIASAAGTFDQDVATEGAGVIFEGDGGAAALGFVPASMASTTFATFLDNRDNVTFRDFAFFTTSQTADDIGRIFALDSHSPGWFHLERCGFYGFNATYVGSGVVYINAVKLRMVNCHFKGCVFTGSSGAVIRGDNLTDVILDGVHLLDQGVLGARTFSAFTTGECGIRINGQGAGGYPVLNRGIHPWHIRRCELDSNWTIGTRLGGNGGVGGDRRVSRILYEDNSVNVYSANFDGIGAMFEHTDHVEIRRCWFGLTAVPLSRAIYCTNVTDVLIDRVQTDTIGVVTDGRGANRIQVDSNCTNLEVYESDWSLLECTKVARVRITNNGVSWDVTQDATTGAAIATRTRDVKVTAAGGGGTGTATVNIRPEATTEVNAKVFAVTGPSAFRRRTDAVFQSVGSVATLATAVAGSANPATAIGGNDVSTAAGFGTSTAAWTAGGAAGTANSDKAILTVTNNGGASVDFLARITETIRWGEVNPAMFLELFGAVIDAWYDDTTINNNAGAVDFWYDRSGNHRDLSQGTAGFRPTYNATANASRPGAVFDGTNDVLTGTLGSSRPMMSFFAVGTMTVAGSTIAAVSSASGSFAAGGVRLRQQDGSFVSCDVSGGSAGTIPQAPGATFRTFAATSFSSRNIAWVDGASGTPVVPNTTVSTGTNLSVGATQGGSGFLTGTLQCLIVFNQWLPASVLGLIQTWAKARYATP